MAEGNLSAGNGVPYWFTVRVKSRHEAKVEQKLVKKKIEVFSPMYDKLRQWKDRKKKVKFPLFPGYLFVHVPIIDNDFYRVLKTIGVVDFVRFNFKEPAIIPDKEIMDIKQMVNSEKEIDVFPYLKEGTRVRVKRGSLTGVEGVLERKENGHMLLVSVKLLNRSVAVKILAEDVEEI